MFYQFMKWYLGWMIKLHFGRIYRSGRDKTPDGNPAIFASNHPAGFIEPIILATNVRQDMHFLVLGSFLTAKWLKWFFNGVKMVPIYRRDITGNKTIEKNKSTFEFVDNALQKNSHILIYPEAKTQFIYKVRPLRKGIVRMTRGYLAETPDNEMYIVPVGVNFIWPSRFRSEVFLHIGDPIKFYDIQGSENEWYVKNLDRIKSGMKELMFNVEDEYRHETVQYLVQWYHNQHQPKKGLFFRVFKDSEDYNSEILELVNRIDNLSDNDFSVLKEKTRIYRKALNSNKLNDRSVISNERISILHWMFLIIGLPFFLIGGILNSFSLLIAYWAKKKLVKRLEYKAAVASAIPAILTLIIFILFLILGLTLNKYLLVLAFLFPLGLYWFIYYLDLLVLMISKLKWKLISAQNKSKLIDLKEKIFENLS